MTGLEWWSGLEHSMGRAMVTNNPQPTTTHSTRSVPSHHYYYLDQSSVKVAQMFGVNQTRNHERVILVKNEPQVTLYNNH